MFFNHPFRTFFSLFAKSRSRALCTTINIAKLGVLTILLPGAVLGQTDEQPTVVLVPKSDFPEDADIPARYTVDYGPVVWLELTADAFGQLHGRGVDFTLQQKATILHLDKYQFDPLVQLPTIPPEEQAAPTAGVPGRYYASHAEAQLLALNERAIGVSNELGVCDSCQQFFSSVASYCRMTFVVADPDTVYVFKPDGNVRRIPRR